MPMNETAKKILLATSAALGMYGMYRIMKGDKPGTAIKKAINAPAEIAQAVVEEPTASVKKVARSAKGRFVKGSKEAKEYMRKLAGMRKNKGKKSSSKKAMTKTGGGERRSRTNPKSPGEKQRSAR